MSTCARSRFRPANSTLSLDEIEEHFFLVECRSDLGSIEHIRGYMRDWWPGVNNNSRHVEPRYKDVRRGRARSFVTRTHRIRHARGS